MCRSHRPCFRLRAVLALCAGVLFTGCGQSENRSASRSEAAPNTSASIAAPVELGSDPPAPAGENGEAIRGDVGGAAAEVAASEFSARSASPERSMRHESAPSYTRELPGDRNAAVANELSPGETSAAAADIPTAAATSMETASIPPPETAASPDSEPSVAPAPRVSLAGETIEVFFATDRLPTDELIPSPLRIFAPAGVVLMLCCALFIGLSAARRFQALWLVSCGVAVCAGLMVLHMSIIRWQQYSRLASNAATRFSTSRYESGEAYPLHVGIAKVSLPTHHQPGRLEAPSILRLEFIETPEKHIVLHSLTVNESVDDWYSDLTQRCRYAPDREGFIFVHGYNVRFGDALKRTAQLSADLDLRGPAICYSWPSRGQVAGYTADEATVSWSAPHFEQLLLDLRAKTNCRSLNIVAHSMGNRALLQAIERISLRMGDAAASQPAVKVIDQLVMAAPDVDVKEFESRYVKSVNRVARRTTLYFSDSDRALQLSASIHGANRLGFFDVGSLRFEGVGAIEIGPQSLFGLGHSYYGSDPAVIEDLKELLHEDSAAQSRPQLRQVTSARGSTYWQLDRSLQANRTGAERR